MIGYGTRKNYFEILTFLQFEQGITRAEKIKVLLHFPTTEICLSVLVFSFEFPNLEILRSKFKKGTSRAGKLVTAKYNITLNFPTLDFPPSIGRKVGISK